MSIFFNKNFNKNFENPKILYHGTNINDIKILEPKALKKRNENEGAVVFSTPSLAFASMFIVREADDGWTRKGSINGVYYYLISDKKRWFELDKKGGYIYAVEIDGFSCYNSDGRKNIYEWVSKKPVSVISKKKYENSTDIMLKSGVNIYFVDSNILKDFSEIPGKKKKDFLDKIEKFKYKK